MKYDKEIRKDEIINREGPRDVTSQAIEIYQSALEFIEQHNGELESMVLLICPQDVAKDKRALCTMVGPAFSISDQLLVALENLFQRIEPVQIAILLNGFINCIPEDKTAQVLKIAEKIRDKEIEDLIDEIEERFKHE